MTLFSAHRKIKLQDIDAAGIVFFPRIFEYCNDTLFDYMESCGMNLPGAITAGPYILPLVHAESDFRAPLRFGDAITVDIVGIDKGKSSITVHYQITKSDDGTVSSNAQTVHAAVSTSNFKKMTHLPDDLIRLLNL